MQTVRTRDGNPLGRGSGEELTRPDARALKAASTPAPAAQRRATATRSRDATAAQIAALEAGLPDTQAGTTRSPFLPNVPISADPAWHLARRVAPGPTPAVVAAIRSTGRSAWLEQQLKPAGIDDSACAAMIAKLPAATMTAAQAVLGYYDYDTGWKIAPTVIRATHIRRVFSRRCLLECMVEFWHDLLHVTAESDKAAYWMGDYDTYAIRKFAMGKFAALLPAAIKHPAMLDYLDNSASTKEQPNENLGRELLELHTVGVGNFTEEDVKQATLLLTGWYADWSTMTARFEPSIHHVGRVTVCGASHANGSASEGPAALAYILGRLARSRATARRICQRLAVRFVSDNPPAALVDRLTTTYLANDTAIVPVLRTLFNSAEFANSVGAKWRRPSELLVTMARACKPALAPIDSAAVKENPYDLLSTDLWLLDLAGHTPLNWPPPDGYPDLAARWMSTNGMLGTWNMAEANAGLWEPDRPTAGWGPALGITASMPPAAIANRLYTALTGFTGDASAKEKLTRYLWTGDPGGSLPPTTTTPIGSDRLGWFLVEAVRLVLASPYFAIR